MFRRDLLKLAAGLVLLPGALKRVFTGKEPPKAPGDRPATPESEWAIRILDGEFEFVVKRWGKHARLIGCLSIKLNGMLPTREEWREQPSGVLTRQRAKFYWEGPGHSAMIDLGFPVDPEVIEINGIEVATPRPFYFDSRDWSMGPEVLDFEAFK